MKPYKSIFKEASENAIEALQYIVDHPEKSTPQEVAVAKSKLKQLGVVRSPSSNKLPVVKGFTAFENKSDEFKKLMAIMFDVVVVDWQHYNPQVVKEWMYKNCVALYKSHSPSDLQQWDELIFFFNKKDIKKFETWFVDALLPGNFQILGTIKSGSLVGYKIWFD